MVHLLTFLVCLPVALAVPFLPSAAYLPVDARTVAFDESTRSLIAFSNDGRRLGTFPINSRSPLSKRTDAKACNAMTPDDIENCRIYLLHPRLVINLSTVPGIEQLREEASKFRSSQDNASRLIKPLTSQPMG